jgi:hypothetical protein
MHILCDLSIELCLCLFFLLDKLDLIFFYCRDYSINKRKEIVIKKLKTLFLKAWFHEKDNVSGKLDTYFSYKSMFQKETYLSIKK